MRINKIVTGKKSLLIGLAGIIVVIAVLELTNTTHIFHKQKVPPVIPAHTNNGHPISNSQASSPTSNSTSNTNATSESPPPSVANHTIVTPFGNFVSNHFPGQNGTSTSEASVCNTSPGATCYIKFTNTATGENTQLTPQTADAQGYTSWYWDVSKDAHLSSGKWRITAVATLGNQTKSTDDALNMVIQ